MTSVKLPTRYKPYGVGKFIGGSVYLHKSYEHLIEPQDVFQEIKKLVPRSFPYTIVKQNLKTGAFTFIEAYNFNEEPEPLINNMLLIAPAENKYPRFKWFKVGHNFYQIRMMWGNPVKRRIYHHKWLFVKEDYQGFNIEQSRQRSIKWMQLDGVDYARIGNLDYWVKNVTSRLPDEDF